MFCLGGPVTDALLIAAVVRAHLVRVRLTCELAGNLILPGAAGSPISTYDEVPPYFLARSWFVFFCSVDDSF